MRACPTCKASVSDDHRFCGYCGGRLDASGADVAASATNPVPTPADSEPSAPQLVVPRVDKQASMAPLLGAKTRPEAPLSPLAQSAVMDSPVQPRVRTAPTPAVSTPSHMNMPRVKRETTTEPPGRRGLAVLVTWSDGRKYSGALERIEGGQCLVTFPDGQQRWLERALVEFVKS